MFKLLGLSLIFCSLTPITSHAQGGNITVGYGASMLTVPDRTFDYYSYRNVEKGGTELNMPNLMHGLAFGAELKLDAPIWFELHFVRRFSQSNVSTYFRNEVEQQMQWRRRLNTMSIGVAFGEEVRIGVSIDANRLKFRKDDHPTNENGVGFKKAYYINKLLTGASIYLAFRLGERIECRPYLSISPVGNFLRASDDLYFNHPSANFGFTLSAVLGDSPF